MGWVDTLSDDQVQGELEALRSRVLDQNLEAYKRPRWHPADLRQAHSQCLMRAAGAPVQGELHPLAEQLMANGKSPGFEALGRERAIAERGPEARGWDARQVFGFAIATGHYGDLLQDLFHSLLVSREPSLFGRTLAITSPIEPPTYAPTRLGTIELDVTHPTPSTRVTPRSDLRLKGFNTAADIQLGLGTSRLRVSEVVLTNDDIDGVAEALRAVITNVGQIELALAFDLLNNPPTLRDEAELFVSGNNLVGSTARNLAIEAGQGALRAQTANGAAIDAELKTIIVPAADEFAARALIRSAWGDRPDAPQLVASTYLNAGAWFFMADPLLWPTLLRATLRGSQGRSLSIIQGNPPPSYGIRDLCVEVNHTVAFGVGSRTGIAKVSVA